MSRSYTRESAKVRDEASATSTSSEGVRDVAKSTILGWLVISAVIFLPGLLSCPVRAQCPGLCGDINGNGTITSSDFRRILDYLYSDSSLSVDYECADVDDYDIINMHDVQYLMQYIFLGLPAPICPATRGRMIPTPSLDVRIEHTALVPANTSNLAVLFRLYRSKPSSAVSLSVQLLVEGEAPTIDSVDTEMDWSYGIANAEPAGAPVGTFTAGLYEPTGAQNGESEMVTAYISIAPSPNPRLLTVEYVELPPIMDDKFGVPTAVNVTMVLDHGVGAWVPAAPACAIWNTGDVNLDLGLTSSDVIAIVNYVFKSGFQPYPCPAAADVNCTGQVTSSDIINLVNYVFKGGPAPCDVCTLIPGTWSCDSP